jgi:hypothetical protein
VLSSQGRSGDVRKRMVYYGYIGKSDYHFASLSIMEATLYRLMRDVEAEVDELVESLNTDFWVRVFNAGAYPHLTIELMELNFNTCTKFSLLELAIISKQHELWGNDIVVSNEPETPITIQDISDAIFRMPILWAYNVLPSRKQPVLMELLIEVMELDADYLLNNYVTQRNDVINDVAQDVADFIHGVRLGIIASYRKFMAYIPI